MHNVYEMNLDQAIVAALLNGWISQMDAMALLAVFQDEEDEVTLPEALHPAATTVALVQMRAAPGLH
jgi:hypothetical protein